MTSSSDVLLEMMKEQSKKIDKLENKVDELIALKKQTYCRWSDIIRNFLDLYGIGLKNFFNRG